MPPMFDWLIKLLRPRPSPKVFWIGTTKFSWYEKEPGNIVGTSVINLFEDENGKRSVEGSTGDGMRGDWTEHQMYGKMIIPYLNNCPLDYVANKLIEYNVDYWSKRGYNVSKLVQVPDVYYKKKEKPELEKSEDGKVIQFPKEG